MLQGSLPPVNHCVESSAQVICFYRYASCASQVLLSFHFNAIVAETFDVPWLEFAFEDQQASTVVDATGYGMTAI